MKMPFQKGHAGYRTKAIAAPVAPSAANEADIVKTWRFAYGDLSDMGIWLLGRLAKKLPHLNDRNYVGWLRGCMDSSEFFFLRTTDAVGLFQRFQGQTDPAPRTKEMFAWCRPDKAKGQRDLLAIYDECARWSKDLGATEIIVGCDSDMSNDALRNHLIKVYTRNEVYVKL